MEQHNIIVLSRFFDQNVKLVSDKCWKCYQESDDVKIISVNTRFLQQMVKETGYLSVQNKIFVDDFLNETIRTCKNPLFNLKNIQKKNDNIITANHIFEDLIVSYHENNITNKDEEYAANTIDNLNQLQCFRGFCSEEIIRSNNYNEKCLRIVRNEDGFSNPQTKINDIGYTKTEQPNDTITLRPNRCNGFSNHEKRASKIISTKIKNFYNKKCYVSKYFSTDKGVTKVDYKIDKNHNLRNTQDPINFVDQLKFADHILQYKKDIVIENISKLEVNREPYHSIQKENVIRGDSANGINKKGCVEKRDTNINNEKQPVNQIGVQTSYPQNVEVKTPCSSKCIKTETEDPLLQNCEFFIKEEKCVLSNKKPCFSNWIPPKSPHNLIEESLYHDPWALLVATIFLNKTSCMCARQYIEEFLKDYPNPIKVLNTKPSELEKYFTNLGLRKRAIQIWRMSYDFIHKNWKNVNELYGIGQYGSDAFKMFVIGDFNVEPKDRFLRIYKAWYELMEKQSRIDSYNGSSEMS